MTRIALVLSSALFVLVGCGGSPAVDSANSGGSDASIPENPWATGWHTGALALPQLDRVAFAPDGTLFLTDGANGKLAVVELPPAALGDPTSNHFETLSIRGALVDALGGADGVAVTSVRVHPLSH